MGNMAAAVAADESGQDAENNEQELAAVAGNGQDDVNDQMDGEGDEVEEEQRAVAANARPNLAQINLGPNPPPEAAAAEPLLLESLEDYNRNRGIHLMPEGGFRFIPEVVSHQADAYFEDENYASNREREGQRHQDQVHRSAFADHDARESGVKAANERFVQSLEGKSIVLVTSGGERSKAVPLNILASSCDTVLQMMKSKPLFDMCKSDAAESSSSSACDRNEIDLQDFELGPVEAFLEIVIRNKPISNVSEADIIDVVRISHYLQCTSVCEQCIDIIKESIDSDNCLSICSLSDQLASPSLFEASVQHLLSRLDDMQNHEQWDDFPMTLRHHVITMRNAVQSSILGRGQKMSIFFSSSDEFLAIFSDNIRDQKERLAEAKLRQKEVISERVQRGGRHRDPFGGSVADAEEKIKRQEKRLRTLEEFYSEQKQIFARGDSSSGGFRLGYS